ncbi:MAG TPA: hypothetical protein VMU04_24775 [Candidatus Acidoferrum sp.]|nr:hypothetical protein [Candidatus Acidoferrum sp.]
MTRPRQRAITAIPDTTFEALRPGRGPEVRAEFIAFWQARPQFKTCRRALAAFKANEKIFRAALAAEFGPPVHFVPDVTPLPLPDRPMQTPAPPPLWLQQARQRIAAQFSRP